MITLQNITSSVSRTISRGENTITKPHDVINIFHNYFSSAAETTKQNIKHFHKHFSEYLKHQCNISISVQPIDSKEITNIISTLDMNKSSAPKYIP